MNINFWKSQLNQRGLYYVLLEIKLRIVERTIKNLFFIKQLSNEQKERINHYFYYTYLKKKYKNWIEKQSIDLTFNKQNDTKIIWWCWLQGEKNAPILCKKCFRKNK